LCICAKNYENWLGVDKGIPKITRLTFFAHPVKLSPTFLYQAGKKLYRNVLIVLIAIFVLYHFLLFMYTMCTIVMINIKIRLCTLWQV